MFQFHGERNTPSADGSQRDYGTAEGCDVGNGRKVRTGDLQYDLGLPSDKTKCRLGTEEKCSCHPE